jgi:hypothetical protein
MKPCHMRTPSLSDSPHLPSSLATSALQNSLFYVSCGVIFQCYPHQETAMEQDTDFIPNLPEGPLNFYRNQASFDWKKLKLVFDKPEILKLKVSTMWYVFS